QHDSRDIDGRTPLDGAILDDVDADGTRVYAEAHPASGSLPLVLGAAAFTPTSATSAPDRGHGDDADGVDLVRIAEDPLHRHDVLHCVKLREHARESRIAHSVPLMMMVVVASRP